MNELPAHSELGASQMSRWDACPGSVALSRGMPNTTSIYAAEGTAAHELAAFCLSNGDNPRDQIGNILKADGFEIEVTEDMAEAVIVYLMAVRGDYAEFPDRPTRLVEHQFHLQSLHPKLHGTADCVQMYHKQKLLRVYDYKHGAGVPVEVMDNKQLKYYGLGALLSSGMPAETVELIIVQPRCKHPQGPVRVHRIAALDLIDFSADLLDAVKRTEVSDAPLVAGDHCRWCKASAVCPELAKQATARAKIDFRPEVKYNPVELAENLRWLPVLEGWIENVRKFAYAEALRGNVPPGHKLVDKRANRKWAQDEHTTEIELGKIGLAESEIFEPRELLSPAKIEKVIGKPKTNAAKHEALAKLVKKESSGTALVQDTDPREPHKNNAAADFA
jgi:hypothetical protein